MTTTVKTALELLASGANNQLQANLSFAQIDQLLQAAVVDKDLATPPVSPTNGALYIVAASPTGAWSGQAGKLAYWLTSVGAWTFVTPRTGFTVAVLDELDGSGLPRDYRYNGSSWVQRPEGGSGGSLPVVTTFTGNLTAGLSNSNRYNISQDGTAQVVTIPLQSAVAWPDDAELHFEQGGAGTLSFLGASGVTINRVSTSTAVVAGQYGVVTLKRKGLNNWTLFGALGAA